MARKSKASLLQIAQFINDTPKDWYFPYVSEDWEIVFNTSDEKVSPAKDRASEIVSIQSVLGDTMEWQGKTGEDPTRGRGKGVLHEFDRWLTARTHQTFIVSVKREHAEALQAYLKTLEASSCVEP